MIEIHLVPDTNLLFECRNLDQLPWRDLGHDVLVLLLTKPVLDDIDKHNYGNGRTRALEMSGYMRTMLTSGVPEVEIRAQLAVERMGSDPIPMPCFVALTRDNILSIIKIYRKLKI